MSDCDVKKMIDVNYLGSVKMTQALLPDMITNRDGAIIFTSSVAGLVGVYGLAAYCGSKFAVRGYAEALAMGKYKYVPTYCRGIEAKSYSDFIHACFHKCL